MMGRAYGAIFLLVVAMVTVGYTSVSSFPDADEVIRQFDNRARDLKDQIQKIPLNPANKPALLERLRLMFKLDQDLRETSTTPDKKQFSTEEREYFWRLFIARWGVIDGANTDDMKQLVKSVGWLKISEYGEESDHLAWFLVQHADHDVTFQKLVLEQLAHLYPSGETRPGHYAYLYDRIAAIAEHRPQMYGSQGHCVGPGEWTPYPSEDPENLDKRRASMGMSTMAEYIKLVSEGCF